MREKENLLVYLIDDMTEIPYHHQHKSEHQTLWKVVAD
jgi:hypothetical protein